MIKTIMTYYCDRCGEKIEQKPLFCCSTTHPNIAIQILIDEWEYADLCDKCKESLKIWWKIGKKYSTNQTEVERNE